MVYTIAGEYKQRSVSKRYNIDGNGPGNVLEISGVI